MTDAIDPRAVLARLLSDHMEPTEVQAFVAGVVDPIRLLAQPQMLLAEMRAFTSARCLAPLSREATAALVRDLAPAVAALAASSAALAAPPPGAAYARLVADAVAAVGRSSVATLLAPVHAIQPARLIPSGTAPFVAGTSFEAHTANVVRMVVAYAEGLYKPLLRSALALTWAARGEQHPPPATTLGAVMGQCRDAWDASLRDPLLDDRVRIVRNSEGHLGNEFDAAAMRVTFVNERKDGSQERLEMSQPEFAEFVRSFMDRSTAMFAAARTS